MATPVTRASTIARYLLGGLIIAGFWYLNRSRPPWEEALRTVVVFTVIMAIVRMRLRRRGVDVHLVPLVITKAVIVAVAAAVETAIEHRVSNPTLLISAGLLVAVALCGAVGDRYFFRTASTVTARYRPAS